MTPGAQIERGFVVLYRAPQACPSCGRGHWHVGRESAECAFCGTALALSAEARSCAAGSEREGLA